MSTTDLAKLIAEEGALAPRRAVDILDQVAEALDAAHDKGLVHRDVKPSNVLIAQAAGKEHAYLADFGLTKRTTSLSGVTAPGDVVGTLDYVAPEQISGGAVDARADLYSLGCVVYESLTGSPPFPRATDVALLWAHVHEEPRRPTELRPELPKALDVVLVRALAKDPARRYRTCGELIAACRTALGLVETVPATRRRLPWVIAGAAALAAAAILAGVLLSRGSGGISSVAPNSVGVIDPQTNKLVGQVAVGVDPKAIVAGHGAMWVANVADQTISRIDPEDTSARARTIPVGDYPSDLALGGTALWVALGPRALVARINPARNVVASPMPALGKGVGCLSPSASVAVGAGSVWLACQDVDLGRFDPSTRRGSRVGLDCGLLTSSSSVTPKFSDLAFGLGSLWVVNQTANSVTRLDPSTCQKLGDPITVGQKPTAIAVGPKTLWIANFHDDTVTRLTFTGRDVPPTLQTIPVGDGPVDVAVGDGSTWVANELGKSVSRIDEKAGKVVATIDVGNAPQRLAPASGSVWVTVRAPTPSQRG
jgi:DNA-binding beta-propeller fold protein YncE